MLLAIDGQAGSWASDRSPNKCCLIEFRQGCDRGASERCANGSPQNDLGGVDGRRTTDSKVTGRQATKIDFAIGRRRPELNGEWDTEWAPLATADGVLVVEIRPRRSRRTDGRDHANVPLCTDLPAASLRLNLRDG